MRLLSKAQKEAGCTEFEIFNEPDLDGAMGCPTVHDGLTTDWKAPNCQYFKMFREAALAIKRVDKRLLVGGPATSGCRWLESLAEFTRATETPIDFLSTHSYPNDPTFGRWEGGPGGQAQTDTQYKAVAYAAKQARGIGLPLYMTEWSSDPGSRSPYVSAAAFSVCSPPPGACSDPALRALLGQHDTTDTAAWIIASVASLRHEGLKAYSYWTFR